MCPTVWYVYVPKLVKTGTVKQHVVKKETTQCTVKTLKLVFSKWPPPHIQPSKARNVNIFWTRKVI